MFKSAQKGFTLIELLVVIAILAILATIGMTVFSNIQKGSRDAKRKTDVDSIAQAYELKASNSGSYQSISDADFTSGKKPKDPLTTKGDYFNYLASDYSGFKVCASLDDNSSTFCNTPATNCYCKFSAQTTISSSSTADPSSTNYGSGPGGNQSPACDPNGSLYSGLVGYWKMDEASGLLIDSSGRGNTGTWYGTGSLHYTTGMFGNGGGFNGLDDYVDLGSNSSICQPGNSVSMSAWVKLSAIPSSQAFIISGDRITNWGYRLGINVGGTVYVDFIQVSPTVISENLSTSTALTIGTWYHLVGVRDNNNKIFIYVNGNPVANRTASSLNLRGSGKMMLGSYGGTQNFLPGLIDDARIYNRVLSPSEITSLYNGCIY